MCVCGGGGREGPKFCGVNTYVSSEVTHRYMKAEEGEGGGRRET